MKGVALTDRADALLMQLEELRHSLAVAADEYESAASKLEHPETSGDEDLNAERRRHAETMLAMYRKKLEDACASVEGEFR